MMQVSIGRKYSDEQIEGYFVLYSGINNGFLRQKTTKYQYEVKNDVNEEAD